MDGLTGPVTVATAVLSRDVLRTLINATSGTEIVVDVSAAGPWDLAGLQVLIAADKSAGSRGKSLRVKGVGSLLQSAADRAGLADWLRERTLIR